MMTWNLHRQFSSLILRNLYLDKTNTNVTLVAEDDQSVDAHRFVLTYASSFFRDIFVNNPEKHLTLHLQGLKYETLTNLVKYIYLGEVLVRKQCVKDFKANASKWNLVKLIETQESKNDEIPRPFLTNIKSESEGENLLSEAKSDDVGDNDGMLTVKEENPGDDTDEFTTVIEDSEREVVPTDPLKETEEEVLIPPLKKKKIRFECDLCGKDFSILADLMQHKKGHTGKSSSAISRPGGEHGSNIAVKEENMKEVNSKSRWSSDISYNNHACDQCDYKCSRPVRLRQHKKIKHGISAMQWVQV